MNIRFNLRTLFLGVAVCAVSIWLVSGGSARISIWWRLRILKSASARITLSQNGYVERVTLTNSRVSNHIWRTVTGVPELPKLNIIACDMQDCEIARIENLTDLREVSFAHTSLAEFDLTPFHNLHDLEDLWLTNTSISSRQVVQLRECDNVRRLMLANNPLIDDTCIDEIAAMTNLEYVWLDGTGVSNEGIALLIQLRPDLERK